MQVVPQTWRRALHAAVGVLAAAAVAGLAGDPLPLTDVAVGDLGVAGTERPTDVLHALGTVLAGAPGSRRRPLRSRSSPCSSRAPPPAARGGSPALGALQLVLVLVWAPAIAATGIVVGTWLLCGILAARPYLAVAVRPLLVAATQRARNES